IGIQAVELLGQPANLRFVSRARVRLQVVIEFQSGQRQIQDIEGGKTDFLLHNVPRFMSLAYHGMAKHVSETPATRFLRQHGTEFSEHPYPYEEHGGSAASARALGVDEHSVIK